MTPLVEVQDLRVAAATAPGADRHREGRELLDRAGRGAGADRRVGLGQDHDRAVAAGLCAAAAAASPAARSASATTRCSARRAAELRELRGRESRLRGAERGRRLQPGADDDGPGDRRARADPRADAAAPRPRPRRVELFRALALPDPEHDRRALSAPGFGRAAAAADGGDGADHRPGLVIFDEPTTALDVTTQIEVLRAFKKVVRERGTTAVYVSHDLAVVAQMADRIVVLRDGAMREIGATPQILAAPQRRLHAEPARRRRPADARPAERGQRKDAVPAARGPRPDAPAMAACDRSGRPRGAGAGRHQLLESARGAALGVIGESGSGKTHARARGRRALPPASGHGAARRPAAAAAARASARPRSCAASRSCSRWPTPRSTRRTASRASLAGRSPSITACRGASAPARVANCSTW